MPRSTPHGAGKAPALSICYQAAPMSLSPSSSIIIDLLLIADAAIAEDTREVRRLSRRVEDVATKSGLHVIAKHAHIVEMLAKEQTAASELAHAVDRLISEAERAIHDIGIWTDQGAESPDRRSA